MAFPMTYEDAVRWYRAQQGNEKPVLDNYFDLPVQQAACRYTASEEFAEVRRLLGDGNGRSVLDVGAGNGIASHALACSGWQVTALEPDPSLEVGAGAIRVLAESQNLPITILEILGESLPCDDGSFDAVYARQVLHHARDLDKMVSEAARVLKPGGVLLATREHVADNAAQLAEFKRGHPLHRLYQGEHAFPLKDYRQAIDRAGLRLVQQWGPLESILNFYPGTEISRQAVLLKTRRAKRLLYGYPLEWRRNRMAGRLYSFLAVKE